jgi:hypothetical protein
MDKKRENINKGRKWKKKRRVLLSFHFFNVLGGIVLLNVLSKHLQLDRRRCSRSRSKKEKRKRKQSTVREVQG